MSFDDKVRFLSEPANYRERPTQITLRETHHAWLFMTARHVFKMKKPFRLGGFDFSALESRHRLCTEEFRLNRRLAKDTYLGVVALVLNEHGEIELDADGLAIEWLVKMQRLADSQSLLDAASRGRATPGEIRKLMRKLHRFYSHTPLVPFSAGDYAAHMREKVEYWRRQLFESESALPRSSIDELAAQQRCYVDANSGLLESRAGDGYIRDGHGDLRPEHVFLVADAEPEVIDCLEFDPELRRLDSAAEIAFLAMQCRHEGFERLAADCFDCYRLEFGREAAPLHLWNFYASLGATLRAGLSVWRIPAAAAAEMWRQRARSYVEDALRYVRLARG